MKTAWHQYLIDHYTERLTEETRPEAIQYLRTTLKQIKSTNGNNHENVTDSYSYRLRRTNAAFINQSR